jgi:hypothetical protein
MKLEEEQNRVNKYIIENILQLPASYVLNDYNEMIELWKDVKVTPEMTSLLNEARQKTINADILIKLNEVIAVYNENETNTEINSKFKRSIINTIKEAQDYVNKNSDNLYKLCFEHDLDPSPTYAGIVLNSEDGRQIEIETDLDFSPYWGILDTEKWLELEEYFEGIFIGEEEFIQEFRYAFLLQSYMKIYKVLEELELFNPENNVLPKGMIITIGEHDSHVFEFTVQ